MRSFSRFSACGCRAPREALLRRARDAGCHVVHTPYSYNRFYRDASETFGVLSACGGRDKIANGESSRGRGGSGGSCCESNVIAVHSFNG